MVQFLRSTFVTFATLSPLLAGQYSQNFTGFSQGTTNLNDGSEIESNSNVTSVRENNGRHLRLTASGTTGTSSSFKLPELDPGRTVASFSARFDLYIGGGGSIADGISLTFGDIPGGAGGGEAGFASNNSLIVAWDTYNNGGDQPSVEVFSDGISIDNNPHNYGSTLNQWIRVTIFWDENGLDVNYDGDVLANNLPTPGFIPKAGDRFAFSARTGGLSQDSLIDNLTFTTTTSAAIETGGPVINEFVASNEDGLEDEDLDSSDWLEIYNGQDQQLNLDGYFLTNDPTFVNRWRIPSVTIDAYDFLVVFASAKNRALPNASLHTDFRLAKEGGYLALIAPDGVTVISEFNYAAQAEDIAFGPRGISRTLGYLETPTPGIANRGLQADGPPAEDVEFDRRGGLFSGSTTLGILPPVSPSAVVRYTTDGTIPDETSPIYTTGFSIADSTTIRARIFEPGRLPGEIKSRTLLELDNNISNFSSNLPILVVDSFGVNIDNANNPGAPRPFRSVYTVLIDRDEATGLATVTDEPDFTGRGGMHVRGQSSSSFPKKQYAWETWNNEDEDKDVSILGMPSESDWVLYAPYSDKALMRNAIVYETARKAQGNFGGVRTHYVEVFFNRNQGTVSMADYRGVYVLMEKIKRDKERVDVERLGDLTTDPEKIKGGYIFKKDKSPYSSPWSTAIEGVPLDMHYPEQPNLAQFTYLQNYVNEMEAALHSPDSGDPSLGYQAYLDRTSFIDAHLFTETFKDIDGYRISTYYSKSRDGKIRALPVWDFNLGLGNADYLEGENPTGWYYPLVGRPDYYWYQRLFQDPEFDLAYWDRFWEFRRDLLSTENLMAAIDRHDSELDGPNGTPNAVTRNFNEWNILGNYVWPNAAGYRSRTTHQAEVDWMKNWLSQRLAWMETQSRGTLGLATPPSFNRYGGQVSGDFDLVMSDLNGWPEAEIYYTLDGSDPRPGPAQTVTLVGENAPCEVLVPSTTNGGSALTIPQWTNPSAPPNTSSWIQGNQGVGYERSSNNLYDPYFNLDIEAEMASQNPTCYIRIPFVISSQEELDAIQSLTLRIRYDDSFVAYLNGAEIVREANAPATLTYNSGANDTHNDNEAITYTAFQINGGNSALQVGTNMLAIHGLNRGAGSSDALWSCLLEGRQGGAGQVAPSALVYSGPIELGNSVNVRARVFDGNRWSPLTQANLTVDAVPASAANLVISEINYRPTTPSESEILAGYDERSDFEYIELLNIDSERAISLEGVTFTDGVQFAGFTNDLPASLRVLAPGQRVILANNRRAFVFRHGEDGVAGEYEGSLRNEGEQIILLAANGLPIRDFSYGTTFPWPEDAGSGSGFSLVLKNPLINPDHELPSSWRSSVTPNGSPFDDDSEPFTGDPNADLDGDGYNALIEYALGTSDDSGSSTPDIQLTFPSGPDESFGVSFKTNLAATGVEFILQSSNNLSDWAAASELTHVSTLNNGDGTATRQFLSNNPSLPSPESRFYRLQILGSP